MIGQIQNPQTLLEAMRHFDPETARSYVASIKWPTGEPVCPKCGSINVGTIKSRNAMKQCREKGCRLQFSLTKGTVFESSHLRLDQWCVGVWLIINCRNGVSSCEIARHIGCKQQSAWHLLHRVRYLLQQDDSKMGTNQGEVETDSTFIGGLLKFMPYERQQRARLRGKKGKTVVHAVKERRTGTVRARILTDEIRHPSKDFIDDNIAPGAMIYTDAANEYRWLDESKFGHESVNHTEREYVRGRCHTNGLESFFNCLRRGLKGTYITASPEHLQAYVDEQVWRFNNRADTDWQRFEAAMRLVVGKRLSYEALTDGAVR